MDPAVLITQIPVGILAGLAVISCAFVSRLIFLRSIRDIPGPSYSFVTGALAHMRGKPSFYEQRHLFVRALHRQYGPVVKLVLPFGRGAMIFSSDAKESASILSDTVAFPQRPAANSVFKNGLLSLPTASTWRAHRSAVLPALSTKALKHYHPKILLRAEQLCDEYARSSRDGSEAEVHFLLTAATLDIIGDIGFGTAFGALADPSGCPFIGAGGDILAGQIAAIAMPSLLVRVCRHLPSALMPESQRKLLEGITLYTRTARAIYDSASAVGPNSDATDRSAAAPTSLLTALAQSGMPFPEARDEIISLLIAGHETTANTLTWALLLLAENPHVQARARAQIAEVCGEEPVAHEDLARLPLLRGIFLEALRLYPTVPTVGRKCARATRVGGHHVPAGTLVFHSAAAASRDTALFGDEAGVFDPMRHETQASGAPWHAFGGGPRKCLGSRLAEQEAIAFLAVILRRFEIGMPSQARAAWEPYTDVTLGPKRTGLYLGFRTLGSQSNHLAHHQTQVESNASPKDEMRAAAGA